MHNENKWIPTSLLSAFGFNSYGKERWRYFIFPEISNPNEQLGKFKASPFVTSSMFYF